MSNQSVLGKAPASSGGAPKSGFSLDQAFTFTMSAGMLLPVYKAFVNPGERISGCPKFFLRTDNLLAPVMGDVDVFVDTFFVPMRHLCAPFDQWAFQIDDNQSDMFDPSSWYDRLPVLNASRSNPFYWMTKDIFEANNPLSFCNFGFGLHRLLMHLGYNPQALFANLRPQTFQNVNIDSLASPEYAAVLENTFSPNIPLYALCAYQKIYMDYYRDTDFEDNNVFAYNFDSAFDSGMGTLNFDGSDNKRLGMFTLRYRNKKKDYFTAVHRNPLFNTAGMLPFASSSLSEMNNWLTSVHPTIDSHGTTVQVDKEDSVISGSGSVDISVKDIYPGYSGNILSVDNAVNVQTGSSQLPVSITGSLDSGLVASTLYLYQNALTLASLRSAFAYDKLLRITNRAGKHVDDQILAHFGYKIPAGISNEVYALKSYHSIVHFGEVTATASTEVTDQSGTKHYTDVGEMSGKGYALLNGKERFTFTAPVSGVFMAIISCAPRYKYLGAVEKDGFKMYLADFFKPSLDHLGQQPLFGYELGYDQTLVNPGGLYSWQYRWMEDKLKFDRASLVFATSAKNAWTFAYPAPAFDKDGDYQNYLGSMKVRPTDFNHVMVNMFSPFAAYPSSDITSPDNYINFVKNYLSDPFTVDFQMDFKRVSEMSTFGEPALGGLD